MTQPESSSTPIIRTIFFALLFAGTVLVFLPFYFFSSSSPTLAGGADFLHSLALVPVSAGLLVLVRCMWDFSVRGKGTPAPIDPPKELVVSGFYRYVRNPMYLGGLMLLLGEAWFFGSAELLLYTGGFALVTYLFVIFYEEPTLSKKFGTEYTKYCEGVPRWIPRRHPWDPFEQDRNVDT